MSFPSLRTRQEPIMVSKKMANGTEYRVYGQDGLLEEEENVLVSMAVSDFKAFHQIIGSNG